MIPPYPRAIGISGRKLFTDKLKPSLSNSFILHRHLCPGCKMVHHGVVIIVKRLPVFSRSLYPSAFGMCSMVSNMNIESAEPKGKVLMETLGGWPPGETHRWGGSADRNILCGDKGPVEIMGMEINGVFPAFGMNCRQKEVREWLDKHGIK